jgi:UDPglucose 6-dehydrogenase
MRVGFVGLGNLGLPMAYAFKFKDHEVIGYDLNPVRMDPTWFKEKEMGPNGESDLKPFLVDDPINYASSLKEVMENSDVVFVTVQTPNKTGHDGTVAFPKRRENYNLSPIISCLKDVANEPAGPVIAIVSTVLPGTIREKFLPIFEGSDHSDNIVHNPMFCAMGTVLPDLYDPEFVLLGSDNFEAAKVVAELYSTINNSDAFITGIENAEMIKTCYNGFISMKINYANTIMEMAHKIPGCNSDEVMDCLFKANKRLISTKYLRGGMGDGGGCHPKENSSLSWLAQKLGLSFDWFEMNMHCRERQTEWLADIICEERLKTGYPVAIFGTAFKEETNLEDGSPALLLINILKRRGIEPIVYDPFVERVNEDPKLSESTIVFLATRHETFKEYNYPKGSIVIDPWRYMIYSSDIELISIGENI